MEGISMDGIGEDELGVRDAFRHALRRRVGDARFATWFEGSVAIAIGPNADDSRPEARILAASAFEQGLLRKQFAADLEATAQEVLGDGHRVAYAIHAAEGETSRALPAHPGQRLKRVAEKQPAATCEAEDQDGQQRPAGWITGEPNAAATQICVRLASGSPGPSPVLLWGPSGVGKTHLLQKLAESCRSRRRRCVLVNAEQFLREFVDAARGNSFASFRQRFQEAKTLLIDDVQHLLGKRKTIEELRQTIDVLSESGAQVVLSADRGPTDLRGLGTEITSRIAGGLSVEIAMPDHLMRKRLALQAAERIEIDLSERAATALAARLIGGGREISGAVNRLALHHETFGKPIDELLAVQAADETNCLSTPPVRLDDIQRAVCDVFGVDAKTLRSDKRTKAITEPRMLAMFLAREKTGSAWSEIGDFFGRRSHSTVIAAHRRVEKLLQAQQPTKLLNGELGESIRRVEAALRTA